MSMNSIRVRPLGMLLAMAAGLLKPNGPPVDPATSHGAKAPRRMHRQTRYHGGTFHRDFQRGASLRRRMGGNANRIRQARDGLVWDDQRRKWVAARTILPEEVEAYVRICLKGGINLRKWFKHPSDTVYNTEIRGHRVTIFPTSCGPIRYKEITNG